MEVKTADDDSIPYAVCLPFRERIDDGDIDLAFLDKFPLAFVKKNIVFPLKTEDGRLMVAVASPRSLYAVEDMGRFLGVPVSAVLAPQEKIMEAINRHYERLSGSAQEVVNELHGESLDVIAHRFEEPKDLLELTNEAPIIRLLNSLLFQAVKERASDIHIEPFEREVDVRFRRDGVLSSVLSPPKVVQEALISRVKIMAGIDIAEKRLPQDGRIRLLVAGKDIDVRVSVVPTTFGERVVLRLLDRKGAGVSLQEIGLSAAQVEAMDALLKRNNGIILATGPTGSGKTTTLYAAMNRINSHERNIITIEDPVEYQLRGVGQIQVNTKIGLTFARGLRSMLRQDPDVIMVGEIRDLETAEMAIQASLTGHLVLSTLHTNDAPSAVTRLVDMGIQTFLLSSSLTAVLAQRLVRVLC
ncbi:MAG: ATPase, T2SS/T4P/T4SS family, partial [Deltaproteobacteria bacterium]